MSTSRVACGHVIRESNSEPHRLPDRLRELFRDSRGQDPGGQPPGLRMRDQPLGAATELEAILRQLRALARAGVAGDDQNLVAIERLQKLLAPRRDRQFGVVLEDQWR